MQITISKFCPNCKSGDLIFDYYNSQIRCLSCKATWIKDKIIEDKKGIPKGARVL